MKSLGFVAVLGGVLFAAASAWADIELKPIAEGESRVDFSGTQLRPVDWAVMERDRYGEVVTLDNGHVVLFYAESTALAFRDSHPVDFHRWFQRLEIDGIPQDGAKPAIREKNVPGGPMTYAFVSSGERTCIAFRTAVGKPVLYNAGYPGHEALLRGVLCEDNIGEAAEEGLRREAGNIRVIY
ncbi:hypothetical protein Plav_2238 [Parvibaculum lavamentivorans DS-1]|uniref:Uncharacterized protein n=1 Tax=Parvibaculum lavamentivorans (strain DS-1 / DSM 13023 / NCIMB 13966) TaxID=402881 RepID=A7HVB9_PARL1|nr:hypothetical protein [Parvibaculum lavamentivorans]ABS63852.1 hypothetical protein Plav_2238 [Parvibaculum lavamentivorans DS-1]